MKNSFLSGVIILTLISLLSGCQEEKQTAKNQFKNSNENNTVKEIKLVESPNHLSSPSDAAIHQYEVILKNGEIKLPNKNSIISQSTVGNNSIVAIHSPEGSNRYAVFLYSYDKEWFISGLTRLGYSNQTSTTNKNGLKLPMNKFTVSTLKTDSNHSLWTFADNKTIISIAKFNRVPFSPAAKEENIRLKNGNTASLPIDPMNNPYLYFFDHNQTVVVSGNTTKANIITIANSLPSASSPYFPETTNR